MTREDMLPSDAATPTSETELLREQLLRALSSVGTLASSVARRIQQHPHCTILNYSKIGLESRHYQGRGEARIQACEEDSQEPCTPGAPAVVNSMLGIRT